MLSRYNMFQRLHAKLDRNFLVVFDMLIQQIFPLRGGRVATQFIIRRGED